MGERLAGNPRTPGRRQLLWVALVVAAGYLPLTRHLAWQISAYVLVLLALRLATIRWPAASLGRWSLGLLTAAGLANCLDAYHTLAGRNAGTALFVTMLALKLLESRTERDLRVVGMLVGFLMVLQFLFDQSLLLVGYLALVMAAVVWLLIDLNDGLGPSRAREGGRVALRVCVHALPVTLVLFVLFPRLDAPLWSLRIDGDTGQTGISGVLEPGAISELVINGELAFRVRFDGTPPNPDRLYWRGPVLWQVDGRRWSPGASAETPPTGGLASATDTLDYEVVLEPTDQIWLFVLDLPLGPPEGGGFGAGREVLSARPVTSARRYRASSALEYRTAAPTEETRRRALQLPENVTPRMRDLADRWRAAGDDWQTVQNGLRYFNREPFHYTLSPPRLGTNPVDQFLFETRRGFCEHYASSFAVLMRLAGIPSRVVVGYLGGEQNRIGGYTIVWQSDAHAWVEVLIADRGWVRVDPTAAVAPGRVDNSGASRMLGAGAPLRFTLDRDGALVDLARTLRLWADTVDALWQDWVLDYSSARQLSLLDRLGLGELRELGLTAVMLVAIGLVLGIIALGLVREGPARDPLERCYLRFCKRLAAVGLSRHPREGPWAFGQRVARARPDLRAGIFRFLRLYVPLRFGPEPSEEARQRLVAELRRFRPRRRRR